jgi:hypothetical protein
LKYTVCGQEVISLNDPLRAIFLYSRNGSHAYEPRAEHIAWYNVDWSEMDTSTYSRSQECVIDDYSVVEDSYNVPILVETSKTCIDFYSHGKSIYPSLELCADAVLANNANCGSGDGYFFYSISEKLCRCCTSSDANINT